MIKRDIAEHPITFALTSFTIGHGLIGEMREFKIFNLPLGQESLSHKTESKR